MSRWPYCTCGHILQMWPYCMAPIACQLGHGAGDAHRPGFSPGGHYCAGGHVAQAAILHKPGFPPHSWQCLPLVIRQLTRITCPYTFDESNEAYRDLMTLVARMSPQLTEMSGLPRRKPPPASSITSATPDFIGLSSLKAAAYDRSARQSRSDAELAGGDWPRHRRRCCSTPWGSDPLRNGMHRHA